MLTTFANYRMTVRDLPRSLEVVQADTRVSRETEYYKKNIGNAKSINDFMADDRLFAYAMKAHGLEEMTYAKAMIRKVLEEGRDDSGAFVNRLTDLRYQKFAETFDFKRYDAATTSFTKAQQGVVDKYVRQQLEENAGATNEGVRLALYFQRAAPLLTSTEGILADRALSTVVRTALQIPKETAFLAIDKQVAQLDKRLNIADFKDPQKLSEFIDRFTNLWDVANSAPSPTVSLFGQAPTYGVSTDLLLTIQRLR